MSFKPSLATHIPSLVSTTERTTQVECSRFRILVVGRSGTGKTALINAIFLNASFVDHLHTDINQEITSESNKSLILHDSQGYESDKMFDVLENFVHVRCHEEHVSERIHAIWLCVTVSSDTDGPLFQPSDERVLQLNRNKVPLIVVFTKTDLFGRIVMDKIRPGSATDDKHGWMKIKTGQILYTLVSVAEPATLQGLVKLTMEHIHVDTHRHILSEKNHPRTKLDEDLSRTTQITLVNATQVDIESKMAASIRVGQKQYWRAIASSVFIGLSFRNCLDKIHEDIVIIWNIQSLNEYLLSNAFRSLMMLIVDDIIGHLRRHLPNWANCVFKRLPQNTRCFMGYVVDLTLILQAICQLSLSDSEGKVLGVDRVKEIIHEFYCSDRRKKIHGAIMAFVNHPLAKASAVDKIRSQVYENRMTNADTQFDYNRPTLPSLFTILRMESVVSGGSKISRVSLNLLRRLLDFSDYDAITSASDDPTDTQLLLDFILEVLRNKSLLNSGIQDAHRKSRKLMFKVIKRTNIKPTSLFITDISLPPNDAGGLSQFGQITVGMYKGRQVGLRLLYQFRHQDDPIKNEFYRDILVWLSLSHRYILPLLGLYEIRSQLILVSPFMKQGTLTSWRKIQHPSVDEIRKRLLEVAEGLCYLHSEGIVHGNLCGANVFLDLDYHCQITDFGIPRHTNITNTLTTAEHMINFAAPELFGTCSRCFREDCQGCYEDDDSREPRKTFQTDIYAFACLYYAIFYDTIPFQNKTQHQIVRLVTNGINPDKLENPRMTDDEWILIKHCWAFKFSERPTMEQVVKILKIIRHS